MFLIGLALLLGALAGLPWFVQYSYSRGYDYFLWIYNAWVFNRTGSIFDVSDWSSFSAAGHPFFKIAGLFDCVVLAHLSRLFGPFGGTRVFILFFYQIAASGVFALTRRLTRDSWAACVSTTAYVFSWFLTFTVYYQANLSNFALYALLPWFVYWFYLAVERERVVFGFAAGILFFASITANAQVAIKILLLAVVWLGLTCWSDKKKKRRWVITTSVVGLVGGCLALFNVVSALQLQPEIVGSAVRLNSCQSPLELFMVPLYGINFLYFHLWGTQLFNLSLHRVLYSGYPGISILCISLLSWSWFRRTAERQVTILWGITGGIYLIYWAVMGFLPASAWIGIGHNLLAYTAFCLAILSGFGYLQIKQWVSCKWGETWSWLGGVGLVLFVVLDLGSVSFFLTKYGTMHTHPAELPEATAWRSIADKWARYPEECRFFTFNPDHTVYLFPVLTGRPTANVIELRQRNPEYQAYLNFLERQVEQTGRETGLGRLLALLNVGFVDLPSKAFIYQGAGKENAPYGGYLEALALLDSDPDLTRVCERSESTDDLSYERQSTDIQEIHGAHRKVMPRLAQVIYSNQNPLPGFIPNHVVALVGNTREGEYLFEEVATRSSFVPDRVGFLLVESFASLNDEERAALSGYYPLGASTEPSLRRLSLPDIYSLCETVTDDRSCKVAVTKVTEEKIGISCEVFPPGRFLFVSYQYFNAWKGRDQDNTELATHKAGAGLTAIYLPASTRTVSLTFTTSRQEQWARLISFGGGCGLVAFLACALVRHWWTRRHYGEA